MFAIPPLFLLVLVDTLKPQEYVAFLQGFPLLYLLTAMTLVGFLVDVRLGLTRLTPAPQLLLAVLFVGWCLFTMVPRGGQVLMGKSFPLLLVFSLFLLIAHAVQSFRALRVLLGLVLALGILLAAIGVHQAFAPWGCHRVVYDAGSVDYVYDGRECEGADRAFCNRGDVEPGYDYRCEHLGLFGTQSIHGRVRFRGTMEDPNELALAVAVALPLVFAVFELKRSKGRLALLLVTLLLTGACVVYTGSRGGQVVLLLVLGVYFVRRYRVRGMVLAAIAALPIVLLGGRDTDEAAGSTMERLECWATGLKMFQRSPLIGVGYSQFTEHHYLTAHNSYVLTAAELGFPGMVLWTAIVWLSIKIPMQVLRHSDRGVIQASHAARTWALALLAALVGVAGGMALLSYAYKELLWIYLGLSAALFQSVRRHAPGFQVSIGMGELAGVAALDVVILIAISILTRVKLGY